MTVPTLRRPVDDPAAAVGARFAGLEGYRGLAALAIVVYHVYQYQSQAVPGSFGDGAVQAVLHGLDGLVSLFFVLSAFLLFLPYARAVLRGGDGPSARAFLVRRAARIVPLYVVAILLVWAWRNPGLPGIFPDLALHLTFAHVYDDAYIFSTIGPAWSLAVEVQFYLLLAAIGAGLVALAPRLTRRGRSALLWGTVTILGVGSLAWKLIAWLVIEVPGDAWSVWFGLPAKLDEFALGMGLAVVAAAGTHSLRRGAALASRVAGLAVVIAAVALRPDGAGEHTWFHTAMAVGFLLLLAGGVLGPESRWERLLGARVPALLGLVSYSLYLWHEPIMTALGRADLLPAPGGLTGLAVGIAVVVPLAFAVSLVSYELIERPGNALRGLIDRRGRSRDYYDGS